MFLKGINVKVLDNSNSYVSFRYLSSNARSRIKKEQFMQDFRDGKYLVINPDALEDS